MKIQQQRTFFDTVWPGRLSTSYGRLSFVWRLCFAGSLLVDIVSAHGQSTNVLASPALPGSGSPVLAMFRVLGALALVLGVFFGGLWVFRNWPRLACGQGKVPKLAIFEAKALGQRHTIYVIGYEQQRMLVAASPTGVTMLTALPEASREPEVSAAEMTPLPHPSFGLLLQGLLRRS
jgi:flagellar biogenesis protein FliO